MKIEARSIKDVTILDCSGNVTLGEPTFGIRNTVRDFLKDGRKKIVLNFAGTKKMDIAAVGGIVSAAEMARMNGGALKLENLSNIKDQSVLSSLSLKCDVYTSEEKALASFH